MIGIKDDNAREKLKSSGIQMKSILIILSIFVLFFSSCSKKNNPVNSEDTSYLQLGGYGSSIDSVFYKEWSDYSWESFGSVYNINGNMYVTIMNSEGDEYYYSTDGYAGFKFYGDELVLFDEPLSSLPDSILFNKAYTFQTTFTYGGYSFEIKYEETLLDTTTVGVSFGTFNGCMWMKIKATITSNGQTETDESESWIARGPADIKIKHSSGSEIEMTKGIVNGIGWGMTLPKVSSREEMRNSLSKINTDQFNLIKKLVIKIKPSL